METEEEKLKKKLKINRIAIILLVIVLSILLCGVIKRLLYANNGVNNNDSNLGLATQGDDFVLYYQYGKGLIKKDKEKEIALSEDQAYSIHYFEKNVYYTTSSSTGGICIKRIGIDGKKEEVLLTTTSKSTKMYLQDSKIYYLTSNPDTISKMDLNGQNEEAILQRSVEDFKVVGKTIYFSDIMGFLYCIDTNGKNYKTLIEETAFQKFQILDKDVYYFDQDTQKLMKINLENTSKKEEITNQLDCDIYNVTTNGIYYFNKEKGKIAYISLKGENQKDIINVGTDNTRINVIGTTLYYIDYQDGKTVTKIAKTNGKGSILK